MAVVRVQVSARGLDRGVAEDVPEDVERDACVGHPGRAGVPEPVASEVGQSEVLDDLIPVCRVPQVAVVSAPTFGPTSRRSSGSLPSVSRSRIGRSGSRIGSRRSLRPLVCLVMSPPLPG